jgi:Fic family protein
MSRNNKIENYYREWQRLQPLRPELQHRMDQQFMLDFNYASNHLEGNTLTYGQTKMLLLFGRVEGEALFRDYEEMKAHNVGLEMMKREAKDKNRPLSEHFIRTLNDIILAGDFYKLSEDRQSRYKIHAGIYKTRPNSVITPSGEMFEYALPEETPAMMSDLLAWYNAIDGEKQPTMHPIAQAALFHYRYIRIHPFEDGNGRIARLLMNYILLRNGYPMIVIPTTDRKNYLNMLEKCDKATGKVPFDGANAAIEQIEPFMEYIAQFVEKKFELVIPFAKGEIRDYSEVGVTNNVPEKSIDNQDDNKNTGNNEPENVPKNVPEKMADKRQLFILKLIKMNNKVSAAEIAEMLKVTSKTIKRDFKLLQDKGIIAREGSERGGHWKILSSELTSK